MIRWQEEIKILEDQIQVLEKRIEANFKERERLTARQNEAEEKLKSFDEVMEEARKSRQKSLVLGENISELNEKIKGLTDEKEIRSDEILGIKDRLDVISQENSKMHLEMGEAKQQVLILRATPLIEKYNEDAEKLAQTVSAIWESIATLKERVDSPNAIVFAASTWGGALICIPRLYSASRFRGKSQEQIHKEKEDFFKKK